MLFSHGKLWRDGELVGLVSRHRFHAVDRILCGESDKYQPWREQHFELGDEWRNDDFDFPWWVQLRFRKRFNEREPNGDDDLHPQGDQCFRLDDCDGYGYRKRGRGSVDHNNYLVPQRNPIDTLRRLYDQCERRDPSLHIFDEYLHILCHLAGGTGARCFDWGHLELARSRTGKLRGPVDRDGCGKPAGHAAD